MSSNVFSSTLTKGVGRRIFVLFLVAALVPVFFTAFLAYSEINRSIRQEVQSALGTDAKAYGVDVLSRLTAASDKAQQIVASVERSLAIEYETDAYLVDDFEAIWIQDSSDVHLQLFGNFYKQIPLERVDMGHLQGGSQLMTVNVNGRHDLVMARLVNEGEYAGKLIFFDLKSGPIWVPKANLPYMTDFCVFAPTGETLFCTNEQAAESSLLADHLDRIRQNEVFEGDIEGEMYIAASWQLFMASEFRHPAFDIVALQPASYALRSGADFGRVFPPALALVIVLVGFLSFSLIGRSLVPLRRLTVAAGEFAGGKLSSRVRMRTGDEFQDLGDAFNNMAERLGKQISTLKAMSDIDRMILSDATFEKVCECVVGHLVELTGCGAAAVIAKDADAPRYAKMVSFAGEKYEHERIASPQENADQDSEEMHVLQLANTDREEAPYRDYFEAHGQAHVVVIPVILNGDLKGRLLLGSELQNPFPEYIVQRCVDIAGRLGRAVFQLALTTAGLLPPPEAWAAPVRIIQQWDDVNIASSNAINNSVATAQDVRQ